MNAKVRQLCERSYRTWMEHPMATTGASGTCVWISKLLINQWTMLDVVFYRCSFMVESLQTVQPAPEGQKIKTFSWYWRLVFPVPPFVGFGFWKVWNLLIVVLARTNEQIPKTNWKVPTSWTFRMIFSTTSAPFYEQANLSFKHELPFLRVFLFFNCTDMFFRAQRNFLSLCKHRQSPI